MQSQRKVLITGSSKGIGEAIAKALLHEEYEVVGLSRKENPHLQEFPQFTHETLDLADLKCLPHALKALQKKHPAFDVVICNAGKGRFGSLEQFSYAQIQELLELNFLAHVFLVKAYLTPMKRRQRGDLIFLGSESALQGKSQGSLYAASKFALRGFAQALRQECAKDQIRVSLINPGMVKTPFFENLGFAPGQKADEHILPEDIAHAVMMILNARLGTNFDEINLSPQKKKVVFK